MARKNLPSGLSDGPAETLPSSPPRRRTAAAVGQSIAGLRADAVLGIVADQVDHGGLRDRLGEDEEAHRALVESIRTYGQQVPVLVRHSPNYEGRYEAIYGRRRIAALKELGRPVRAMIRDMPDRKLIVMPGQENAARRDLTFIEKVNFARQMRAAGFERKVICDALHIDKTVISRMLAVADAVPAGLIEAIGPAPGVGRDRWSALGERVAARAPDAAALKAWARELSRIEGSERERLSKPSSREPRRCDNPRGLGGVDSCQLGSTRRAIICGSTTAHETYQHRAERAGPRHARLRDRPANPRLGRPEQVGPPRPSGAGARGVRAEGPPDRRPARAPELLARRRPALRRFVWIRECGAGGDEGARGRRGRRTGA